MTTRAKNQCCGSGSGRIRTFLVGSGSGRLGPDPDPGLNKWLSINFYGVCKSHTYLRNVCCLTFWSMKTLLRAYFQQKKISEKVGQKFNRVRIRIRNRIRIRTFSKVGSGSRSGSGQKSSGSATLPKIEQSVLQLQMQRITIVIFMHLWPTYYTLEICVNFQNLPEFSTDWITDHVHFPDFLLRDVILSGILYFHNIPQNIHNIPLNIISRKRILQKHIENGNSPWKPVVFPVWHLLILSSYIY
jgi:hypothetical protein